MITADFLMLGAHYSLEQCGLLLADAVTLYERGSYATAIVLAAFAREELGKARELRAMRREAIAGATFTIKDINKRCGGNHIRKQELGQTSFMYGGGQNDLPELDAINRVLLCSHPQTEEFRKADARSREIIAERMIEIPGERHMLRMTSLYVDPQSDTVWSRPQSQSQSSALEFVRHATNDYSIQYDHYQRGNVIGENKELYNALAQWPDRPDLPEPHWPSSFPLVED